MKTLNKIILTSLIGAGSFNNLYSQDKTFNSKADSIYKTIKTQDNDSAYVILEDRNKDKIIDKINWIYHYPNKICLAISSLDNDYDGIFEITTKRLSDEDSLIDAGEFWKNLDDVSQTLKNESEGKHKGQ